MNRTPSDHPILLFDGVCNLCNGIVQFVIARNPGKTFLFASLQSAAGQEWLRHFQLPVDDFETFVLIEKDQYYTKSTAVLHVAKRLSGLWPLSYALIIIPPSIRDYLYSFVARNRYRWFGKRAKCMVPTDDVAGRFL